MEYILVEVPDGVEQCVWVTNQNSLTNRQTRVRENGSRNGDDCSQIVVTRDYILETGGGGDAVVLDGGTVFAFPPINEAGMLYITGFSFMFIPWIMAWGGSRIISAIGQIGRSN